MRPCFHSCGPVATAVAFETYGFTVNVAVICGGSGYTNTPSVHFLGGGGSGAQAVATVSNGVVTAIQVLDAGFGYTNAPLVIIDPPFIPNPVLGIKPISFLPFPICPLAALTSCSGSAQGLDKPIRQLHGH